MATITQRNLSTVTKYAAGSRVAVWLTGFLVRTLCGQYDAGERRLADISLDPQSSFMDWIVWKTLGMFTSWDGYYFSTIAAQGYADAESPELLEAYAFFPLYPMMMRLLAEALSFMTLGSLSLRAAVILSGFIISNISFIMAARQLYVLGELVLSNSTYALRSSLIFCLTPASVFMSALYTESVWAFLSISGMVYFQKNRILLASVLFALCTATRSNGMILIGFPAFHALQCFWCTIKGTSSVRSSLVAVAKMIPCCLLIVSPFFLFNAFAYSSVCTTPNTHSHPLVAKFCSRQSVFGMYNFVEEEFWNVGFLKYYDIKQIPNFILAAPMLTLSVTSIAKYVRWDTTRFWSAGLWASEGHERSTGEKISLVMTSHALVYVWYWLGLTAISFLFLHIQVSTRFMSAIPPVYWFASSYLESLLPKPDKKDEVFSLQHLFRNARGPARAILWWCTSYTIVGTIMFCTWLPWT